MGKIGTYVRTVYVPEPVPAPSYAPKPGADQPSPKAPVVEPRREREPQPVRR